MHITFKDLEEQWSNKLLKFISDNFERNWSWFELSRNPNISVEFIKCNWHRAPHPEKDLWHYLSENPSIRNYVEIGTTCGNTYVKNIDSICGNSFLTNFV